MTREESRQRVAGHPEGDSRTSLLHCPAVSEGFTRLHISGRLELSVEAHVLRAHSLGSSPRKSEKSRAAVSKNLAAARPGSRCLGFSVYDQRAL